MSPGREPSRGRTLTCSKREAAKREYRAVKANMCGGRVRSYKLRSSSLTRFRGVDTPCQLADQWSLRAINPTTRLARWDSEDGTEETDEIAPARPECAGDDKVPPKLPRGSV